MGEPVLVVESREHLWSLLTEASQLEHMIMCEYLYAMFSLKLGVDEGLTASPAVSPSMYRASCWSTTPGIGEPCDGRLHAPR
jgi:hypothetical protein